MGIDEIKGYVKEGIDDAGETFEKIQAEAEKDAKQEIKRAKGFVSELWENHKAYVIIAGAVVVAVLAAIVIL